MEKIDGDSTNTRQQIHILCIRIVFQENKIKHTKISSRLHPPTKLPNIKTKQNKKQKNNRKDSEFKRKTNNIEQNAATNNSGDN